MIALPERIGRSHFNDALGGEFRDFANPDTPRTLAQIAFGAIQNGELENMAPGQIEFSNVLPWAPHIRVTVVMDDMRLSSLALTTAISRSQLVIENLDDLAIKIPTHGDLLALQSDAQRRFARYDVAFHAQVFFRPRSLGCLFPLVYGYDTQSVSDS